MTKNEFELILTKKLVSDFLSWHLVNFPLNKWNYLYIESYKSIVLNVHCAKYDTLMYMYGYKFLLKLEEFFKERELYERCALIQQQISNHNRVIGDTIPLSYT